MCIYLLLYLVLYLSEVAVGCAARGLAPREGRWL